MLAGQPHQQLRPGGLQHRVDGGVTRAGQLAQGPRGFGGHPRRCHARGARAPPGPAGPPRWGCQSRRTPHARPSRAAVAVSFGQPGHEPADTAAARAAAARSSWRRSLAAGSAATSHRARCGGWSAPTGGRRRRCGSTRPGRPAARPGRRPRRVRRRTAAGSAPRHRRLSPSSTYCHAITGSAGMTCTGWSNCWAESGRQVGMTGDHRVHAPRAADRGPAGRSR